MMKPLFEVHVQRFDILREIEGVWGTDNYKALLEAMEFDDIDELSEAEVLEMCVMGLQDLEPEAAAELVLHHHIGDRLSRGEVVNIAHEMPDKKLWEEYANSSLHERMFNVGSLLYRISPRNFPQPDAVRVELAVKAMNESAEALLASNLSEALLVRLLADGMEERCALRRLFGEQLRGDSFPEADTIVWIVETERVDARNLTIDVISSGFWLDALRETRAYESAAHADGPR